MPKMKSHSRAKKTFNILGNGNIKRPKAFKSHLLSKKTNKRKRHLRGGAIIHTANVNLVKRMLCLK
jgi:large subunit ribosomal protein L35